MNYPNAQTFLDRLNLLYYGLISLPLLLFAIVYLNFYRDKVLLAMNQPIAPVYIIIVVGCLILAVGAYFIYRKRQIMAINQELLRDKLDYWRKAVVLSCIVLEGASLIVVVAFYFSKSQLFVAAYGLLLFLVSLLRPTQPRLIRELKLNQDHRSAVQKNEDLL